MKDGLAVPLAAVIGSIVSFAFGIWHESLTLLLVCMAVDYITGISASIKERRGLSSIVGSWGLARKGLTLLIILIAHRIDELLGGGSAVMSAAIYFYIGNELLSIVENCGRIGLPMPEKLKSAIEIFRRKDE
ncbi:phage holin family protein [Paenibacillus albicereus]|uniref:Phage holin family protein n=1 Tax=Paenibacillus albicereus TaxID=2726185 RepID=A0A6H2GWM5_9BACL|nr:phage holin family protein [Paenibacillus albicereus]QJC51538.1 phage holin family protein [Paenibacillus albicereus]